MYGVNQNPNIFYTDIQICSTYLIGLRQFYHSGE